MTQSQASRPSPKSATELLDMYFLDMRRYLLETAAALDRIERSPEGTEAARDPRWQKLLEAFEVLKAGGGDRAERFLTLFSDPPGKEDA